MYVLLVSALALVFFAVVGVQFQGDDSLRGSPFVSGLTPSPSTFFKTTAMAAASGSKHDHHSSSEPAPLILPDSLNPPRSASSAILHNALNFIAIGDWGRGGKGGQEVTAPALAKWAKRLNVAFIISVGDNVYVDGITPGSSAASIESTMTAFFSSVYTALPLAALPWYVIMGNHDYRGSVESQIGWTGDARWHPGLFFAKKWPLPGGGGAKSCLSAVFTDTTPLVKHYKEADYRKRLPILSTNIDAATPDVTVEWTKKSIVEAVETCDAVFVIGHHPLYSPGEHANTVELIDLYEPLLENSGVDAYLAGHDHILAHSKTTKGEVEHVLTGAGSEVRPELNLDPLSTRFVATVRGFTIHSVNATHVSHSYLWVGEGAGQTDEGLPGRIAHQVIKPLRNKKRV